MDHELESQHDCGIKAFLLINISNAVSSVLVNCFLL